ncbi:6-bladed beta-propeller [Parabacteroides sp. PF5-9]|uniref:6-bladed beta-propeller n=1 Tax=Parabacteroides sp. PF5-9 TaxID=1742404 RepID=UPI002476EED1|nr:6-bladed beta-propeller [Parabacteroides sp. PF5-9]
METDAPAELIKLDLTDVLNKETKITVDEIASNSQIIPLETNEHILIKQINKILLEHDQFFILHDNLCSVFNLNGQFIRRIGTNGQGPGEYTQITDLFIDDKGQIIFFDSASHQLFFHQSDGSFYSLFQNS